MPDTLPFGAISAADTIAAIQALSTSNPTYTADEIAAHIRSFVAGIANGNDHAADDLASFIGTLPQDWKHDEASY